MPVNEFYKHLRDNTALGSGKAHKPHIPLPRVPAIPIEVATKEIPGEKKLPPMPPLLKK